MKRYYVALATFLFTFLCFPLLAVVSAADMPGQGGGINVGDSPLNQWQGQWADDPLVQQGQNAAVQQAQQQQAQEQAAKNAKDAEDKYKACMAASNNDKNYCDCVKNGGVQLNTDVPFVGKCINKDKTSDAFPVLIGGLFKMVVTAILIVSFVMIIVGGVMRMMPGKAQQGKDLITKVAIGLAILGASWAILRLINPNFFT